ncbi:MAG: DUF924 family protein [Polyangiales bacterium]|nr:DUF924 domain-containing protein [Myxococcales bacterium]MCB9660703.1 DUF924 domain-containing protein [Sandaracinaceae bacterium]
MTPEPILDEWFGDLNADGIPSQAKVARWWTKSPEFDDYLRIHYGTFVKQAQAGGLQEWDAKPTGTLARLLLLDQFSRNIFRGTPRMFEGDELALNATLSLLDGDLQTLPAIYQYFALMPLMHAEDLALQDRGVAEFEALAARTPEPTRQAVAPAVQFARDHRDVIARFTRFPHRNGVLGRTSTPDESAYLLEHSGW